MLGVEPYFDQPFYVGYAVGGFELGLVPDGQPDPGGVQAYWGVADAEAAWTRLLALGARPLEPVREVGESIRVGELLDPFGNRFSIIENRHFDPRAVR